jgi:hypothetical protein
MKIQLGRLKDIVGFSLVGLHLIAIGLCFFWLQDRMSAQDFQLTILILTPVTALYALAYLREVARNMIVGTGAAEDAQLVTGRFAFLAVVFILAFSSAVIFTIYDFAQGNAQSADDLKISLSTTETALGAFLGLIIETLFGKTTPAQAPQKE